MINLKLSDFLSVFNVSTDASAVINNKKKGKDSIECKLWVRKISLYPLS